MIFGGRHQNHPAYTRINRQSTLQHQSRRRNKFIPCLIILLLIPLMCLVIVFYEIGYLQNVNKTPTTGDNLLLTNHAVVTSIDTNTDIKPKLRKESSIIKKRTIIILIANYRDSKRCAETVQSLFQNAVEPNLLHIGIYDQIYANESNCIESYCNLIGDPNKCTRRIQMTNSTIDAEYAKGPTVARYHTEALIKDEDFCMAIDSHLIFVNKWDEKVMKQWDSIQNSKAIITVYPKSTQMMNHTEFKGVQLMCVSQIESREKDAMIQYGAPEYVYIDRPRLQSQLAGGFNFGDCKQAKEIRNDPYTPYLFHGEEYSRAARLWTHGYDFYAPSEDICFHWYEPRKVVWERDWPHRFKIQQRSRRRVRRMLGLPISQPDVDDTDLDKFSLGNVRTFEQWKVFSGIDPLAPFDPTTDRQFDNCKLLELVKY